MASAPEPDEETLDLRIDMSALGADALIEIMEAQTDLQDANAAVPKDMRLMTSALKRILDWLAETAGADRAALGRVPVPRLQEALAGAFKGAVLPKANT